jgi:hypothetical protein
MSDKLKSRKFWMAVATATITVLVDGLDLPIDGQTVLAFVGLVASWIWAEAVVDIVRAKNGK